MYQGSISTPYQKIRKIERSVPTGDTGINRGGEPFALPPPADLLPLKGAATLTSSIPHLDPSRFNSNDSAGVAILLRSSRKAQPPDIDAESRTLCAIGRFIPLLSPWP